MELATLCSMVPEFKAREASADWEQVSCALCKRTDAQAIDGRGQHGLPTHSVLCPHDGLVYLSPRWTAERYARFYRDEYDGYYRPVVFTGEDDDKRLAPGRLMWRRIEPHRSASPAQILDVGAGMGASLEVARAELGSGVRLAAIESSAHCAQHLRAVVKAEVLDADVMGDWAQHSVARFDIITLRHVLEHFLDPIGALKQVARALQPSGRVYIAVPNMMAPRSPLRHYWFRAPHVYYFGEATLVECARRSGLRPICVERAGAELWGVFELGEPQPGAVFVSPYEAQLAVIREAQQKDRRAEPMRWLRSAFAALGDVLKRISAL